MGVPYPNPPLVEVLVEFRFTEDLEWDSTIPGTIFERIKPDFRKDRPHIDVEVTPDATPRSVRRRTERRSIFRHVTHPVLLQVGNHLVAINNPQTYIGWITLQPLVAKVYESLEAAFGHGHLDSVVLRYINQIVIPNPTRAIADYFNLFPIFLNAPFAGAEGFIVGLQTTIEGGIAKIELRSAITDEPESAAFILDLECILDQLDGNAQDQVLKLLDKAHDRIKDIFEAIITPTTRDLFQDS